MLYVLGGTSRAGKTLLSRRAVVEKQIPYFPMDALFGALVYGVPESKVRYEDSFTERADNVWPVAKHLFNRLLKEEQDYLVEGDSFTPSQISQLIAEGNTIRCCFLGYTELDKEEKLSLIREHHQGDIDWTKEVPDEDMMPLVDQMIEFSKYLKEECAKYGIKYFDISHDFEGVRNQAFTYLFGE